MDTFPSSYGDLNKVEGGLEINVSAPGKVILHGEHAVVYGKKAVAAALGLRSRLKIVEIQQPNVILIEIRPLQFLHNLKISDIQELWSDPSLVTSNISNFNISATSFLNFDSLSRKIDELLEKLLNEEVLQKKPAVMALKCFLFLLSSMKCSLNMELGSFTVKIDSELQIGAGTGSSASYSVSGIDNTVCTYGNMVEFRKGVPPKHIQLKTTFDLLLINTNISRNTAQLVAKVAHFRSQFPVLVDKILDCIENVTLEAIALIKKLENMERAVEGVTSSNKESFLENFQNLTWLSQMNHIFLMSLGVSHPRLQEIMKILEENNLNGKLTGAGGGGFATALLPPNFDTAKVTSELKNGGFGVIFTKLGGEGVTVD